MARRPPAPITRLLFENATIPPGGRGLLVAVAIEDDLVDERDETFTLILSNATNATTA